MRVKTKDRQTHRQTDSQPASQTDRSMDGWMDGWMAMDGWMDGLFIEQRSKVKSHKQSVALHHIYMFFFATSAQAPLSWPRPSSHNVL